MNRALGLIFALVAALTQFASGVLPTGKAVCIPLPSPRHECCCCDEAESDGGTTPCLCHLGCDSGCERCLTVTPPDGRATLSAGPRANDLRQAVGVAMCLGLPVVLPPAPEWSPALRVRPTESPPGVSVAGASLVRSIRLVL